MNEFKPINFDLWKTIDNNTWRKVWEASYSKREAYIYNRVYHKVFDEIAVAFYGQRDELYE